LKLTACGSNDGSTRMSGPKEPGATPPKANLSGLNWMGVGMSLISHLVPVNGGFLLEAHPTVPPC